jgi:signal transduction histidine kinase
MESRYMQRRDLDQPTVLIISDDAEFSHAIIARWKFEPSVPTFTLMSGDLCPRMNSEGFEVAIVGGLAPSALPPIIKALETCGKPVLLIRELDEPPVSRASGAKSPLVTLAKDGTWLDAVVTILGGSLISAQAASRIQQLERTNALLSRDAALGRYILEMRHSFNNALTSVLGNSELLLLEPETLAPLDPGVRSQIDTMRNMSLRMHEIMQRFSSLEKELNLAGQHEANENKSKAAAAASL